MKICAQIQVDADHVLEDHKKEDAIEQARLQDEIDTLTDELRDRNFERRILRQKEQEISMQQEKLSKREQEVSRQNDEMFTQKETIAALNEEILELKQREAAQQRAPPKSCVNHQQLEQSYQKVLKTVGELSKSNRELSETAASTKLCHDNLRQMYDRYVEEHDKLRCLYKNLLKDHQVLAEKFDEMKAQPPAQVGLEVDADFGKRMNQFLASALSQSVIKVAAFRSENDQLVKQLKAPAINANFVKHMNQLLASTLSQSVIKVATYRSENDKNYKLIVKFNEQVDNLHKVNEDTRLQLVRECEQSNAALRERDITAIEVIKLKAQIAKLSKQDTTTTAPDKATITKLSSQVEEYRRLYNSEAQQVDSLNREVQDMFVTVEKSKKLSDRNQQLLNRVSELEERLESAKTPDQRLWEENFPDVPQPTQISEQPVNDAERKEYHTKILELESENQKQALEIYELRTESERNPVDVDLKSAVESYREQAQKYKSMYDFESLSHDKVNRQMSLLEVEFKNKFIIKFI